MERSGREKKREFLFLFPLLDLERPSLNEIFNNTTNSPLFFFSDPFQTRHPHQQYGNVMLDVAGMSKAGIERKATCRALFSKLLFLSEAEELFVDQSPGSAAAALDIPSVFGATDDDAAKLRIVSLLVVDLGKLEEQFPSSEGGGGGGGGGGFFGDQPADDGGSGGGGGGGGW